MFISHIPHERLPTQALSRFGAYHDALTGNAEEDLFLFAKQKLLDGKVSLTNGDGPGGYSAPFPPRSDGTEDPHRYYRLPSPQAHYAQR
jgi:hypothetical protein